MFTNMKDTSNSHGRINIFRLITRKLKFLPRQRLGPSYRVVVWESHLHPWGLESWSGKHLRRICSQWVLTDDHSLALKNNMQGLNMPVPCGASSSLLKVIVLVRTIFPTIYWRSLVVIPSKTWDSFRIFNNTSRCILDNNNRIAWKFMSVASSTGQQPSTHSFWGF